MKLAYLHLLCFLSLLPTQAQVPATPANPAPPTQEEPSYECPDLELEGRLSELKDQAAAGDPHAARQISERYSFHGHGLQARSWGRKYVQMLHEKAEAGDTKLMMLLGTLYWRGEEYTGHDPQEASRLFRKAADAGEASAAYILGAQQEQSGNHQEAQEAYAQAYRIYQQRVTSNPQDRDSLYWLGYMEQHGQGTPANINSALEKLNQAADLGSSWALTHLFKTYTEGIGLPADREKAMAYAARLVALNNDARMAHMLACYFMNLAGERFPGQEPDETNAEGLKYLDIAVTGNNAQAIIHKADILKKQGKLADALPLYRQAASMGQAQAMAAAGAILLTGTEKDEKDPDEGIRLLQQAAMRFGSSDAAATLADFYREQGEIELSNHWIVQASDAGSARAMARRGLLHLSPFSDLAWDPTICYQWWQKGKALGDATCSRYINLFLYVFTPLLLIIVFGVPLWLISRLNKAAAEKMGNNASD